MSAKVIAFVGALCLVVCVATAFEFKQCDRSGAKLISAKVSACPDAAGAYCTLNHEDVNYQVDFTTAEPFEEAYLAMSFNGAGSVTGACDIGVVCPSKVGQTHHLNRTDSLFDNVPVGKGYYNIQILDQAGKLQFCVQFPAKVIA